MAEAPLDIAIVGIAGAYAGASDARTYWQNILDKVDAVTEAGPRWTGPYLDPESDRNDRIYTNRGGFLHDSIEVNPIEFGVLPSIAEGGDPDHLIALKFARDALWDAGYGPQKKAFDPDRAGVIIGRGTYGNRGLASVLSRGLFADQAIALARGLRPDLSEAELAELHDHFRGQLPIYNAEMVGPLTPNVIAGLIANRLNLMGPNYIVDAACASTLIALEAAARELASGRCDLMLTGGVHSHTPPQLYIQFCQIQALSRGNIRPFQKGASGILLGEGVGMLVLKRVADAERDGDRIYAVIKGIGTASDGRAKGLLTPRLEGQVLALQRAYASSGIDPNTIDLIEAHGTGTEIGDKTEIETMRQVFGGRGTGPQIAVGSVKSMIAHCLPASGSASLIKTALALQHGVLPPMLCDEPDPELGLDATPFYINTETRPWIHGKAHPRRAAVSAFGFGGINAHVILEEHRERRRTQVQVLHRPSPSELITLAADSLGTLVARIEQALAHLRGPEPVSLSEVAQASALLSRGSHRLAVVADDAADLITKLEQALEKLRRSDAKPFKTRGGVYYGHGAAPGKLCFLYPGEGAQYPNMLADLALQFPQVRAAFDFMETTGLAHGMPARGPVLFPAPTGLDTVAREALEQRLYALDVAAESVYSASLGLQDLLDALGFKPDAMLGHSTGENTALTVSGVRRVKQRADIADDVRALNTISQRLIDENRIAEGTLLTLGALKPALRAELLQRYGGNDGELLVAMDNCPNQLVLFGRAEAAETLRAQLAEEGVICAALPFGRAYHTALFKPMADALREYFAALDFGPGRCTLYSARAMGPFPSEPNAIRELAAQQWENAVRFTDTLERLYADGYRVFVEVGPSGNLTSFVGDTLRSKPDVIACATDSRRRASVLQFHHTLAQLFSAGIAFEPRALYAHRAIAEIDLGDTPRPARRRGITMKLQMPELSLPANWAPARRLPQPPAADETHPNLVALKPKPEPAPQIAAAATTGDPRAAVLKAHFELMQDFLDSQSRVLDTLSGGTLSVASGAATAFAAPDLVPVAAPQRLAQRYPMLGTVTEHSAGKLVAERVLDHHHDLFLQDHAIGGTPSRLQRGLLPLTVVPFTFSMEMLAEAAAKLAGGGLRVIGFENLRGSRWLALDGATLRVRIVAEQSSDPQRINARIFALDHDKAVGVFEGTVLLAEQYPAAPAARPWNSRDARGPQVNPDGELYSRGMFHGPRLQGVQRLLRIGERSIEAEIAALPTDQYFDFTTAPQFECDAAQLDAIGSVAAYWVTEQEGWVASCFPFRVTRVSLHAPPAPAGTRTLCRAEVRDAGDGTISADFDILSADGRVVATLDAWEDRKFAAPARFADFRTDPPQKFISDPLLDGVLPPGLIARRVPAFADGFLDQGFSIWKRVLAHMVLSSDELARFYALPATGPRREEWLLGRIAAKDAVRHWAALQHLLPACADIAIGHEPGGRPQAAIAGLAEAPAISISHSRGHAIALAAPAGSRLGVDYQRLEHIDAELVARGGLTTAEQALAHAQPATTRPRNLIALWCAKEAAAKAAGSGLEGRPLDWHATGYDVIDASRAQCAVSHAGQAYAVQLHFIGSDEIVAVCVA